MFLLALVCGKSNLLHAQGGVGFNWVKTFGQGTDDDGSGIALDNAGNIYTIGQFKNTIDFDPSPSNSYPLSSSGNYDVFITKYDSAGNFIWARQFGAGSADNAYGIAADANGYVYVTGTFSGTAVYPLAAGGVAPLISAGNSDAFIFKLDGATGNAIWAQRAGGTLADNGYGITVDATGNVYATGSFQGQEVDFDAGPGSFSLTATNSVDIFILKLNATGAFQWARQIGGNGVDAARAIATDASGNVYTTGSFASTVDFDPGSGIDNHSPGQGSTFLSKLDASGNFVWAKNFGTSSDVSCTGYALNIDYQGNVLVTGRYTGGFNSDFDPGPGTLIFEDANGANYVSKFNPSGNLIWAKQFGGSSGSTGWAVTSDAAGNVYTSGSFYGSADFDPGPGVFTLNLNTSSLDIYILRLDASGNFVWARGMGGSGNDEGNGIAVNANLDVYTTGRFRNAVDFDPGPGVTTVTGAGSNEIFLHKMRQIACTNPPSGGTTVATYTGPVVCSNNPVTLSLTGNSSDLFITYEWESSPTGIPFSPTSLNAPSSIATMVVNPVVTTWYRAKISCSGGTPVYSTPVQVAITGGISGGTYTIDQSQPTGGTNYHSFADAIAAIYCGISSPVVFNVQPGVYNEQVSIPQIPGASSTNSITFNGNESTIAFASSSTNNRAVITLNGADHVNINTMTINASGGTYGYGIFLTNQADSNTINGCAINTNTTDPGDSYQGIFVSGSMTALLAGNNANYNTITGNTITGGQYSISLYGNISTYDKGNIIRNNILTDASQYHINLYGQSNAVISGNDISRPLRADGIGAIRIQNCSAGPIRTEKNRIHGLFTANPSYSASVNLVYLQNSDASSAARHILENNLFYDNDMEGTVTGIANSSSDYWNIYHNTIVMDGAGNGAARGVSLTSSTGTDLRNNIISITQGGIGIKHAIYLNSGVTYTSDNNVLHLNSTGTGGAYTGRAASVNYITLGDWQAGSAQDAGSTNADPQFINIAMGNLSPAGDSVNNMAAPLGIAQDIIGAARSGTSPDPGAYEFGTVPNPLPVSWLNFDVSTAGQNNTLLTWSTASEHNAKQYHIQRSDDAIRFSTLGYVAAAGNSEEIHKYQYTDAALAPGWHYYRILQEDADGKYTYTPVKKVLITAAGEDICRIYPNPADNKLFVSYNGVHPALSVTVTDVSGRTILSRQATPNSLQTPAAIDISGLTRGVYIISLKGAGIHIHTKVIKK